MGKQTWMASEWTKSVGEFEDDMDEVDLARNVTLCQPLNLLRSAGISTPDAMIYD